MNEPIGTNRLTISSWIMLLCTAVIAAATVGIFYVYKSQLPVMADQLDVMQGTLQIMEENQRLAQKPMLKLDLRKNLDGKPLYVVKETKDGGQEWMLPYYVHNIGKKIGVLPYNLHYWHDVLIDSVIVLPDSSQFQDIWSDHLLFPDEYRKCGFDFLLRAVWMKRKEAGQNSYRHFVVTYRDEHGRQYGFHAVWRINYNNDNMVFVPVSYLPITE